MSNVAPNFDQAAQLCGISEYQILAIRRLLDRVDLRGKRVLEVGGSNIPRSIAIDLLGASEWICVDVIETGLYQLVAQESHYAEQGIYSLSMIPSTIGTKDYLIFNGGIEDAVGLPDAYFDAVISITCFEHVLRMRSALKRILSTKRREGFVYSYFGPIWSSWCGHHAWVSEEINFNVRGAIPDHAHLLLDPPDLFNIIANKFGFIEAEETVQQLCHSPRINRLFYDDYIKYFNVAGFGELEVQPYGVEEILPETKTKLAYLYPQRSNFEAYGIELFAR